MLPMYHLIVCVTNKTQLHVPAPSPYFLAFLPSADPHHNGCYLDITGWTKAVYMVLNISLKSLDWEQLTVDIQLWDLAYNNIYSANVNV